MKRAIVHDIENIRNLKDPKRRQDNCIDHSMSYTDFEGKWIRTGSLWAIFDSVEIELVTREWCLLLSRL